MSYAEHGSRIFLTGRFNYNVVPRKRSEGRLKLFDSCTDLRAWSPNALDNCRYFREVVEKPLPRGKIVPYDVMIESLIVLGNQTQGELASVRRQLEKYKSLRLTPEQEKKLRDIDEDFSEDPNCAKDSASLQQSRSIEDECTIPKRPETPIQSTSSSSTNFRGIAIDERTRSDDESSTEDHSEDSKEVSVSSAADTTENADVPKRSRDDRSFGRYRSFDNKNDRATIIEKDSEIIALKNELGAKEAELDEFRELSRRLDAALNEKEATMDNLRGNLRILQEQLLDMDDQLRQEMEEFKKKMQTSECLVDHLKGALAEKSQECSAHSREIERLRERIKENELLREERDCLDRKLDEMKAVIHENNELTKLNREQAMNLADQEDEIGRLLELIKRTSAKYDERQIKMKDELDDLRAKIEAKNSRLSQFEARYAPIRREASDTVSFVELPTPAIRKIKCRLQENLDEAENELAKRMDGRNDRSRIREREESGSRAKDAIDDWNKTMVNRDSWEGEKEYMGCTTSIEPLTMQVSATNAPNEEQDEIVKRIASQFHKLQQLIVELEPYERERPGFIERINRLNEALEEVKDRAESREIIAQKQYLNQVLNKHRKQCGGYEKRIASLTNKLVKLQKDRVKIIESARRENDRRVDDSMDKNIDDDLRIRAKRSIEMIEKLSNALRGAGDYHGREMAKKENELEAINAKISKLREQVASNVSRGQVERENSYETSRLKDELKLLRLKLSETRESLSRTEEKLLSSELKLKGSLQRNKELQVKCKKQEQEAVNVDKKIIRLTKENEGLNKTVVITGELQTKIDEMQPRLESLQDENEMLIDKVGRANDLCAKYINTIADLTDRETRTAEALMRAEYERQTLVSKRASEIEELKIKNETANEESEENKKKIAKLNVQMQSLIMNTKKLQVIENLMQEITKLNKRINKLREDVTTLKSHLENKNRSNDKLEKDLNFKLAENEQLQSDIRELNKNIERLSGEAMPEAVANELLNTLPHKICNRIETLKSQMNLCESEGRLFQSEWINEWREKSRRDALLIEKLRHEVNLYNNNVAEQNSIINGLQEKNENLKKKLEQIPTAVSANSTDAASKFSSRSENELRRKEDEIEKLTRSIEATKVEQQTLVFEKTELVDLLKKEKDSRQSKLSELQQNYHTQIKQIRAEHNGRIKRLEAQYEEAIGKPFNPETWLKSLSPKVMAELHKRVSVSSPCETIREASKIRALNDKQNHQLQLDENKRHSEVLHLRNGHHKESEFGSPCMYEKRTFDKASRGPAEMPSTDNYFDTKKMNFIDRCANQSKQDGISN